MDAIAVLILEGQDEGDWFGSAIVCGDLNNDDFDNLVIGANGYKAGTKQGHAYLYYGGPRNK